MDRQSSLGFQAVGWCIKNNTSDILEISFTKDYTLKCGNQKSYNVTIIGLKPGETRAGYGFHGHAELTNEFFDEDCIGKYKLSSVGVSNIQIKNISEERRRAKIAEAKQNAEREVQYEREKQTSDQQLQREAQARKQIEKRQRMIQQLNEAARQRGSAVSNILNSLNSLADDVMADYAQKRIRRMNEERERAFAELMDDIKSGHGELVDCSYCYGDGIESCESCDGNGSEQCNICDGSGQQKCWTCGGSGRFANLTCSSCGGRGSNPCNGGCFGKGKLVCGSCSGVGSSNCGYCRGTGKEFEASELVTYRSQSGSMNTRIQPPPQTHVAPLAVKPPFSFFERFDDSRNGWTYKNAHDASDIKGGKLRMVGYGMAWNRVTELGKDNDFTCSVTTRFIKEKGYRMIGYYGMQIHVRERKADKGQLYTMGVAVNGDILIAGKRFNSPYADSSGGFNTLSIRKRGNDVEFYVNDRQVTRLPLSTFMTGSDYSGCALFIDGGVVEFDDLVIEQK